ncbi:MAG: phospholipase D-like domain-containing protein, partial [Firmicutes bacterium]|nr:phospholipase D-like domain-containing protein [Bacillota bacterium]
GATWIGEPGAGPAPWLDALARARAQVDVNAYLLTDPVLLQALRADAARGVRVRVLLAAAPYRDAAAPQGTAQALAGSGVHLRQAPRRFPYDHATKYWLVDPGQPDAEAILGSPNGTASAFDGRNLEDAVATTNPAVVRALAAVFQADWQGRPAGPAPRRTLVLSPHSTAALLGLLRTPGPVAVMGEELGDDPTVLAAMAAKGGRLRLLLPAPLSPADRARAAALARQGVPVRLLAAPYPHAKLVLTAHRVFVGSQNWSLTSLQDNREVGLVLTHSSVHTQAAAWFRHWWAVAQPLTAASGARKAPDSIPKTRLPWLPLGISPKSVRARWGPPSAVQSGTWAGQPAEVWRYAGATAWFVAGRLVAVHRHAG